ncbi:CAMK protein kinase [Aphanomyces invadans]|uniref:CAMK protein kinase n=1 Tax=Aphanomyces invadans TaxID=157072 RepID=A0A024UPI6_9STRA|nr:CAMK protein kinase [Aphanomyces invadans]ETW08351.1 CAMK protein kinase [Aphanomyces invadans]|eukprot:XP_008862156.1 CAMK protein kinase [Aphanomyces invadans]
MHRLCKRLACCSRRRREEDDIVAITRRSVEEDYDLLHVVGDGKTCRVYRAQSKVDPKSIVAVKVIQTAYLSTPSRVDALQCELRALSQLRAHPRVLTLFAVYQDDNTVALVTSYVRGGQLVPALCARNSINEHTIRQLVRELVEVLAEMHSRGITHRDLKPENLLLDDGDHLKVVDFGIAHIQGTDDAGNKSSQPMVGLCGTGPFMAPEVFNKDVPYTSKVDIWALGVCVYVLLTGHVPFESKFMSVLEDKIRAGDYSMPSHQQVSATARSFVATCLNVRAADRPSATSLLRHPWLDLDQVQSVFTVPFTPDHMACLAAYANPSTAAPCIHTSLQANSNRPR